MMDKRLDFLYVDDVSFRVDTQNFLLKCGVDVDILGAFWFGVSSKWMDIT